MTPSTPTVPALPGQTRVGSRLAAAPAGLRRGRSTTVSGRGSSNAAATSLAPGRSGPPVGDRLETAIYLEFLYGYGAAPGVDLGCAKGYSKVDTGRPGNVYRQDFQRGLTIANLGAEAVRVDLGRPYRNRCEDVVTSVILPGHSAEVLFDATG